ncbi:Mitochondrial amidoxime reducing component [Lachnellula suecica]|uniref:Mitochondrial amidoxime reducing component n=1 Tax=Lachnellula suecica TaxID=602035 RepID=A0A8T9CEE6_9HELO|nr:Mitochondrial amidoxime reducing component [Lachnellula suecica]
MAPGNGTVDLEMSTFLNMNLSWLFEDSTIVWSLGAVFVSLISYFCIGSYKVRPTSSKAQRAKAMRQAFKAIASGTTPSPSQGQKSHNHAPLNALQISQLWVYPMKSIRGCAVSHAMLSREGFYLDRRFMLLKDHEETPRKLENMHVPDFPNMSLFHTSIEFDRLIVSYRAPGTTKPSGETLEVLLEPPNLGKLEKLAINMHNSPTTAYDMGERCNKWFSERFGFKVVLAYWGGNPRLVLGNLPGRPANQTRKERNVITRVMSQVPVIGSLLGDDEDDIIAFNDCAPYLVINEKSVDDVSARLPEEMEMDYTKFRANIVVKGADDAFEEDYWGELTFGEESEIILTGNCARCKSLNVDYNTGAAGTGEDGKILKLLQKDRRVDPGMKYSPIFGRYGFASKKSEGKVLAIGDSVSISRKNDERTVFYWPGISTTS